MHAHTTTDLDGDLLRSFHWNLPERSSFIHASDHGIQRRRVVDHRRASGGSQDGPTNHLTPPYAAGTILPRTGKIVTSLPAAAGLRLSNAPPDAAALPRYEHASTS